MKRVQWCLDKCVYILRGKRESDFLRAWVWGEEISPRTKTLAKWAVRRGLCLSKSLQPMLPCLWGACLTCGGLPQPHIPSAWGHLLPLRVPGWELQWRAIAGEQERCAASFGRVGMQNKPTAAHVSHRHGLPSQPSITSSFNPQTWQLFYSFFRSDSGCWGLTHPADHSSQTLNGCERNMALSMAFHAIKTSIFLQAGEWA